MSGTKCTKQYSAGKMNYVWPQSHRISLTLALLWIFVVEPYDLQTLTCVYLYILGILFFFSEITSGFSQLWTLLNIPSQSMQSHLWRVNSNTASQKTLLFPHFVHPPLPQFGTGFLLTHQLALKSWHGQLILVMNI